MKPKHAPTRCPTSSNSRVISSLVATLVVVLAVLPAMAADLRSRGDLPADVPADWWSDVQRAIQLEEYAVVEQGPSGTDFRAVNPAHRFEARFDAVGLRLTPVEGTNWEWGLSLSGWGRPGALTVADVRQLFADEDRIEFDRGTLTEWFVNRPAGLEHGFTVPFPPQHDGDRLVFDLALKGDLRPVFAEDGQAVDFFSDGNVSVLRYAKLIVTDVAGNVLGARMEPIEGGIRIVVDDSRAVYPITVDPLATSTAWTAEGETSGDWFATYVSTAGDVNGDGYSDLIVGAFGHTTETGKAYLYLGSASGLAPSASWTVVGEAAGDQFGHPVATAGDVNGDGYADVVVGATGHSDSTGKTYLYLGGASGLSTIPAWSSEGEGQFDEFGWSTATAGDVNGDGYADVIVGTRQGGLEPGKAYLYLGDASGLATGASWTPVGEAIGDRFGESVATAGDVNGDGYADVVVGAHGNDESDLNAGKTYLYLGGASGLSASAIWTADGEAAGYGFGFSLATAGDVNGDGYADVVVGALGYSSATGKVYLYLGGASGLAANATWTAEGETAEDFFGWRVATAGDVNGDGYSDLVVGVPTQFSTGRAQLYLGGANGLATNASWTGVGEAANDQFGFSVATAGDVNGDGYSDLVVGANAKASQTGKAYLYMGSADSLTVGDSWNATGEATSDEFGYSVAPAGDVNGDGYSDVVVGASRNNSDAGKAYLYLGGADGLSANAAWTAVGETAGDRFGITLATAGDVNGDGCADLIVGAFGHTGTTGKAYLYLGVAGGLATSASWTAVGETANDNFGLFVATAGDVNGDGYSDVIVGARRYDNFTGKAYVYLGGTSGLATGASWTAVGDAVNPHFGWSLATAGDVNGDGYADVIVGAYGNTSTTGKAYLYLGGASGLSGSPAWIALGETAGDRFGISVATAGDVNGDGYSDVAVGASGNTSTTGKTYVYLGGASGVATTPAWTAVGEAAFDNFGYFLATAGDVNGDGYSDVIVGAYANGGHAGKAYLYLGGASGLAAGASWTAVGEAALDRFGRSVAAAGDVNGDGYPDLIVGAYRNTGSTGKAYLYFGGGGAGVSLVPRQLRADLSVPISLGGPAFEQQFRPGLTLRSPVGPVLRKLQWQVVPWGDAFAMHPILEDPTWYSTPEALTPLITLPDDLERYIWRARIKYHPAQSPFLPSSPWFTPSGNALHEADVLSTSQLATCSVPADELYITTMTIDGNGKPVLHYQDPNHPSAVTGYNIYRASTPAGPWVLLGANVVDMDAGTPDIQYVDSTGDVGGPWFYKAAAWNDTCGAEGPF